MSGIKLEVADRLPDQYDQQGCEALDFKEIKASPESLIEEFEETVPVEVVAHKVDRVRKYKGTYNRKQNQVIIEGAIDE